MTEAEKKSGGRKSREAELHDELLLVQDPVNMTVHSRLNQASGAEAELISLGEDAFLFALDRYPLKTMGITKNLIRDERRENNRPWTRADAQSLREHEVALLNYRRDARNWRAALFDRMSPTQDQKHELNNYALKDLRWTVDLAAIANWVNIQGLDKLAESNQRARETRGTPKAISRYDLMSVAFSDDEKDADNLLLQGGPAPILHREFDTLNAAASDIPSSYKDLTAWHDLTRPVWGDMTMLVTVANGEHFSDRGTREQALEYASVIMIDPYEAQYTAAKKCLARLPEKRSVRQRILRAIIKRHENRVDAVEWFKDEWSQKKVTLIKEPDASELFNRARTQLWLYYLREVSDLAFSAMAEQARMSKTTVTRFMSSRRPTYEPRSDTVTKITDAAVLHLKRTDENRVGENMVQFFDHRVPTYEEMGLKAESEEDKEAILLDQLEEMVETCSDPYAYLAFQKYAAFRAGEEENFVLQGQGKNTTVPVSGVEGKADTASVKLAGGIASVSMEARAMASAVGEDSTIQAVHVRGAVQAGAFVSALEWDKEEWIRMSLPEDTYGVGSFGLLVRGDSMDQQFPDGSILVCMPFNDETDELPVDKYVIALNPQNGEFEATCKKLVRDKYGAPVLHPESNNPEHKPIPLADVGQDSVQIQAVVVGAILKF